MRPTLKHTLPSDKCQEAGSDDALRWRTHTHTHYQTLNIPNCIYCLASDYFKV